MQTIARMFRLGAAAVIAAGLSACGIESQDAPSLIGPSGFAQSVTLTASPDRLPRDGSSQSIVTVFVRNESGQGVAAQRVALSSNIGTLSHNEVVTGGDGRATVTLTAPPAATVGSAVDVFATPLAANAADSVRRSLSVALTGIANATAPAPSFTVNPAAPVLLENVVFDASATTDENAPCLEPVCTYTWDFGSDGTATGRIVTRQFETAGTYTVKLAVRDAAGTSAERIQNLAVGLGTAPTASFTFSPSAPVLFEPVLFNAEASRAGVPGRTLTSHWNFGDGSTGTGLTTTHQYTSLGTYVVTLTLTDNAGVPTTTTQSVTIGPGITAAFTFSPTDPSVGEPVFFNAEASRGAAGFGGRNEIVRYIWNFGDSTETTTTDQPIVQHSYGQEREYVVVLTVEDAAGRRATTTQSISIDP
jgi:PKD repeat protein